MPELVRYVIAELAAHPDRLLALGSIALVVGFGAHVLTAPDAAPVPPAPVVTRTTGVWGPRPGTSPVPRDHYPAPRVRPQAPATATPGPARTRTTRPVPPVTQPPPETPTTPPTSEEPTHVPSTSVPPVPEPTPTREAPRPDPS